MLQTIEDNGKTYVRDAYGECVNVGFWAKNLASVTPTRVVYEEKNNGYINIDIRFRFSAFRLHTHIWFDIREDGEVYTQQGEDIFSMYNGRDIVCNYLFQNADTYERIMDKAREEIENPTIEHERQYTA